MPHEHDMFGDVIDRPRSMRSRRSSVVVVSVIAHSAAIVTLVIIPLMAADLLPPLPHSVTFVPDTSIVPVLPGPPLKRSGASHPVSPEHPATHAAQVPLVAPAAIGSEKERDLADATDSHDPPLVPFDWVGPPGTGRLPPPPPPAAAPPTPVRIHVGIQAPTKLLDVPPVYPPLAQQTRVEGPVILEATIDASGHVVAARVLKSIPLLDKAALDAVKQWTYTPTLLNGVPVPVVMTVTVMFKLR